MIWKSAGNQLRNAVFGHSGHRTYICRTYYGCFGYTVIYSCDCDSRFYLGNNVLKEWIDTYNFFPVIDFETGDLCGFQIYDNKCGEHMCIFNHEEKQVIEETEDNLFQALVKYGLKL